MSTLNQDDILNALKSVKYPGYSRDIVSFGLVNNVAADQGAVSVSMQLTSANPDAARQIKEESERVLKALPGVNRVHVQVSQPAAAPGAQPPGSLPQPNRVPGVKRVVAVASGKGGVGKSTMSVNLACALNHLGARVGLLDCDIYGPSIPLMMGIRQKPMLSDDEKMIPPTSHGVRLMSIGFLLE
ncbi:MAG TPA: P-loop NTPase, partial [Verrucomicrobiota bacterium]|nr:P-loop NTPase [Verrucomicrobiota bacterium]